MASNENSAWKKVVRKLRRAVLRDEPTYYDMFENPGEAYSARLYLHEIHQALESEGLHPPLNILDAGCQAGRLAIPLGLAGHKVTGVDTSGLALQRAKRHAKDANCRLQLIRADLARWLPAQPPGSFDVVVCAEVLYLRSNYRTLLEGLVRLLRPGGLCFISHRPTAYYMAKAFKKRDWDVADLLLKAKEGLLWGSYYNWQDQEDLETLYRELDIKLLGITPIGLLSWLAVNPETLDQKEQDLLFQAEVALKGRHQGSGRYLLVSGRKQA